MKNRETITIQDNTPIATTEDQFSRTEKLLGITKVKELSSKKIAVFGLGGVGSFVVEALARVGVGAFVIVDNDTIVPSNLNRQLFALHSTIGMFKTECAKKRILDIQPKVSIKEYPVFYDLKTAGQLDEEISTCDYIVDAIDTVSAKLLLIEKAKHFDVPIISSMGTGNKLNPSLFEITTIEKTSVCPLARVMRRELKARHIKKVKVLFSKEEPIKCNPPASISFVPSVAGLLIAGEVVRDLLGK